MGRRCRLLPGTGEAAWEMPPGLGGAALAAAWPWLDQRPSAWPSWDLQGRDKPQGGSELPSLMLVALRHGFVRSVGCVVGVDAVL